MRIPLVLVADKKWNESNTAVEPIIDNGEAIAPSWISGTPLVVCQPGTASMFIVTTEARLKNNATMTPEKRERYAEWLRNTGVEHPSDELINQTQKRALLQIHKAEQKARRHKFNLIAFILCCLAAAVYVWIKL